MVVVAADPDSDVPLSVRVAEPCVQAVRVRARATPDVRAAIARGRGVAGLWCIVGPFLADGTVADRCGG
jgi:hypothetical protein